MSIPDKIAAVREWLEFDELWRVTRGDSPTLQDWGNALRAEQQGALLERVREVVLEEDESPLAARVLGEYERMGL